MENTDKNGDVFLMSVFPGPMYSIERLSNSRVAVRRPIATPCI